MQIEQKNEKPKRGGSSSALIGIAIALTSLCSTVIAGTVTYEYDALGRLKSASNAGNGSKAAYQYDKAGNRTSDSYTGVSATKPTLSAIDFGVRPKGAAVSLDATLTNIGSASVALTLPPTVTGTAYRYKATTCTASLAKGANCAITVEYTPPGVGVHSGELSVVASSDTVKAALSGSGADVSLSPVNFGERALNSETLLDATLTNSGAAAISFTKPGPASVSSGDFSFVSTDCVPSSPSNASLAANSSCKISIKFKPSVSGARSGTLTVATTANGDMKAALSGSGKAAGAGSLAIVTTGDPVSLGTTLTPNAASGRDVVFKNAGPGSLTIASTPVVLSGSDLGFWVGSPNNCSAGRVLAKDETCSVFVYSSSVAGVYTGTLTVNSDSGNITRNVSLAMKGGLQGAADFGAIFVGQTPSKTVTVKNIADFPIRGLTVAVSAPYSVTADSCTGATLAKDGTCDLTVRFAPTAQGTYSTTGLLKVRGRYNQVWVASDGVSYQESTQAGDFVDYSMGLTGIASNGTPVLTLENPGGSPVNLGTDLTPVAASGRDVYYKNTGTGALTINGAPTVSGAGLSSWVSSSWNCSAGKVLQAGEHCSVYVFSQSGEGSYSGNVTVKSSGGDLTTSVNGTYKGKVAQISGGTFGNVTIGKTGTQTITVTNQASYAIYGLTSTASAPYSVTANNCTATLAANTSCQLTVVFTPTVAGAANGSSYLKLSGYYKQIAVDLAGKAAEGGQAGSTLDYPLALSGTGVSPTPVLSLMSGGNLGTDLTPVANSGGSVYYQNTGTGPLTVNGTPTVTNGLGIWTGSSWNCSAGKVLQPTEYCSVFVYSQFGEGTYSGVVSINSNGGNLSTNVSGTYKGRVAQISGGAFGNVTVGKTGGQTIALTNQASYAIYGLATTVSAPYSVTNNNCTGTLGANANCTMTVVFTPTTAGTANGSGYLKVSGYYKQVSNDLSGQAEINQAGSTLDYPITLSGTGVQPAPVLSWMSGGNLGTNLTPVAASGGSVYYQNTGNAPLTVSGTPTVTNGLGIWTGSPWNCSAGKVLQPSEYCSVYVYSQFGEGTYSGVVSISSNGGNLGTNVSGTYKGRVAQISGGAFGNVTVGQPGSQTVTLTNQASYAIYGLATTVSAPYSVTNNNCTGTLGAGANCTMTVVFSPTASGTVNGSSYLKVSGYYKQVANDLSGQAEGGQAGSTLDYPIALSGTGVQPTPVLSLMAGGSLGANLTPVAISGGSIYYKNTGNGALTVSAAGVSGASLGYWTGSPWNCSAGKVLQPGEYCSVYVYSQAGEGTFSGSVSVSSNGGNLTTNVSGTYKGRMYWVSGGAFGNVPVGQPSTQVVTLSNSASYAIYGLSPTVSAPYSITSNGCPATLGANASCQLTIKFTPASAGPVNGNYLSLSGYYKQVTFDPIGSQAEGGQAGDVLYYPIALSGTGI